MEITVCTQKGFLSGGSPVIGMVIEFFQIIGGLFLIMKFPFQLKIDLAAQDLSQGKNTWMNLVPENHNQ